jgi:hypothetical protein
MQRQIVVRLAFAALVDLVTAPPQHGDGCAMRLAFMRALRLIFKFVSVSFCIGCTILSSCLLQDTLRAETTARAEDMQRQIVVRLAICKCQCICSLSGLLSRVVLYRLILVIILFAAGHTSS